MFTSAKPFFDEMGQQFEAGEYAAVAAKFLFPLGVFLEGQTMFFRDADDFINSLTDYRDSLVGEGVVQTDERIVAQSFQVGNSASFWVERLMTDSEGAQVRESTTRYYCQMIDGRMKVALMEHVDSAEPPVAEFAARQLRAV